ncbi:MAG: efflux RND transporter permease subunit [Acidiferrobacterales bacterium]|nr:efflux RND transporter permease subunit [Acidiferrobacterales bacterium]
MKRIIAWWADNHVAANLLMIGILLGGLIGYGKMERELFPTLPFPGMQVIVSWPGASPQDVEEQIVNRIEESLTDLENLDWIRSESAEGFGGVYIHADTDTDFSRIMDEVTSRVLGISSFPPDIEQPRISQWQAREESLRVAVHGDIGERPLKRLSEDLRKEVAALNGISVVELFGIRAEEVSIEVSEAALRQYGISFDEISNAIRAGSINSSAGKLRTDGGELTLRSRSLADSVGDFEEIVIKQLPAGASIKLKDVARVIDGFEENEMLATMNGEPAVLIQVMSTESMDVVLMSESVNNWIEERSKTLPDGVSLTLWNDTAVDFKNRISTIGSAAITGLLLVFVVLLLTLRPIVAVWVAVGIATAYAGAFVFLESVGISLNMLSTFAFLLVLGIVVDDAIIVGERVHSEVERGSASLKAAIDGAYRVSKPVIFGVTTTIIAFLPWLFISGTTQEYTRQIAWVVILALCFSIIEALFILPAHLSTIKPQKSPNALARLQQRIADSIVYFGNNSYGTALNKSLKRPGLTLCIFAGLFMIVIFGLMVGNHVKSAFQPEIESEQISVNIDLREGTTYERALQILSQLQTAQEVLIAEVESNAEGDKTEVVENWYTRSRRDSVIAIVKLAPPDLRAISAKEAATRLRELIGDVPEAKQVSVNYAVDDVGPDLDISVRHPDLEQLQLASDELIERLRQFSSVYDLSHSLESANEEIRFQLKPGAQQTGITLGQVMQQVRQAYYGQEVQRLPREGNDVRVMVRYPLESRQSLESLKHFRIRLDDGRQVPLTSVVEMSYGPSLKKIDHWDGLRSARVRGYLKEPIRNEIIEELEESFYPQWEAKYPGLSREAIGQSAGEAKFLAELGRLLILAFFAMYCMLAVAFKSYSQPALILIAIPFAVVGAVIGHFLLAMPISIWSYFGAVAATGVVVNDNLVLIDSYNYYRKQGQNVIDAIQTACRNRFRPILITSVTTFIGLVPLMLERSSQAAWLQPTVVALAFGLVVAFFVTLFLVPALLVAGDNFTKFMRKLSGSLLLRLRYYLAVQSEGEDNN